MSADLHFRRRLTKWHTVEYEVIHCDVLIGWAQHCTSRSTMAWEAFDLERGFAGSAATRGDAARTLLQRSGRENR